MYRVKEIFYSIQGEGHRMGTPAVFVRFAGCNLNCSVEGGQGFDCDTDFRGGVPYSLLELMKEICSLSRGGWVILTGGEPLLQVDDLLIRELHRAAFEIAVETNGTVECPRGLDWVAVSPKRGVKIRPQVADELRIVLAAGEQPWIAEDIHASHQFLSPAFKGQEVDPAAVTWCVEQVRRYPLTWRLSIQLHKLIGVQ
jgi:organic radical activating enzyme